MSTRSSFSIRRPVVCDGRSADAPPDTRPPEAEGRPQESAEAILAGASMRQRGFRMIDLDDDGTTELLVTVHQTDVVYVYGRS